MIQKKKKELTPEEAFSRLASYCAYAEHSAQEVRKKCRGWEISDEVCDALIERLEQEGYLNEERFARAFVRDKYRFNGWGPLRLQAELRRHRIPSRLIERLTRFALYRGYPYEDVREAISELLSDLPDELGDD